MRTAKQFLTYVNAGAVPAGGGRRASASATRCYDGCATDLQAKRDLLCDGLAAAGFEVFAARRARTSPPSTSARSARTTAMAFCRSLPERCGVVAIPSSVFYADPATGRSLVRFAFCKRTEVLTEAVTRLKSLA